MAAKKRSVIANFFLTPLSWLYGLGVWLRNLFFKWKLLKQRRFDVPVVVIGNLAVGGTGKTPHTEMVISMLRYKYNIGVLSRGYKRRTKGFVLATRRSSPLDIGDEPYQIYHKFDGQVAVAVCEDRCTGIEEMLKINPRINLIVLDDAFQHRYVKPAVSIVLTEFNRPVFMDKLLPLGRLREPVSALNRADMVVVTKCPTDLRPLEYRIFKNNLNLIAFQKLYFSSFVYEPLRPVFPDDVPDGEDIPRLDWLGNKDELLALAGIANPRPFIKYLKKSGAKVTVSLFSDHHNFTRKDMALIADQYAQLKGDRNYIITTEKDAVRLANNPYYPPNLKPFTFYLPIKVVMDNQTSGSFADDLDKLIRDSILTTEKSKFQS